ncbi:hypothetical protein [Emergencia sp.]|uniref:hypothetical protein n=1 Tax=Emergencia sp. TaxID=1926557 RepID=UPI003AEFD526
MKKKKFNLIVTIVVAIALVLSTTVFASAATVKINKKTLSLYAGKTTTVKVLNASKKVTWTSSKKTVATVKSTGKASAKITAKKSGTTTITGKIGKKKYTCKVTVKYATGSRQKPADPTKGITVKTSSGTMYFRVNRICSGSEAENWFKELDRDTWEFYQEYDAESFVGKKLVGIEYEVKAKSGYEDVSLSGLSIINSYDLYNGNCNASLPSMDGLTMSDELGYQTASDVELYNGGSATMYEFILVPEDLISFSNYIYNSAYKQYWVKYTF